jgi:hypothetical protein
MLSHAQHDLPISTPLWQPSRERTADLPANPNPTLAATNAQISASSRSLSMFSGSGGELFSILVSSIDRPADIDIAGRPLPM